MEDTYIITERKRVERERERRSRELTMLNEIGRAVTSSLDLNEVLTLLLDRARQGLGAEACSVALLDDDGDLVFHYADGEAAEAVIDLRLKPGQGIASQVAQSGQSVLVLDAHADPYFYGEVDPGFTTRDIVCVPLVVRDEIIGVIELINKHQGTFTEDDVRVLESVATQAATAIENARLYEAEAQRRQEAETLCQAAAVLTSTLDFEQVLDHILEQVSRVVPNDAANIMLIEGDRARIVRWRGYERFGGEEFASTVVFRISEVPNLQQMLESGEPLVISDTATYPGWVHISVRGWPRSYAAAPISVRGEVIGFLNVNSAAPGFFTQACVGPLRAFADHAAAAIENARLHQETAQRLREAETLSAVTTALTRSLDLDQVLQAILDSAVDTISAASAGTIHLTDESRGRLMPRATFNRRFVAAEMGGIPLGQGGAGLAWKEKRTIHIADVSRDPRFIATDTDASFQSLLVAPLMMGDRCLGTISLHSNETNAFTPDDERLLSTLALQAAIAIENAWLYEKVTERMREATVLHRVSNTLMRTLNLEQLLENILEVLQRSLGYSHCAILLPDGETGELCIKAARGYLQVAGEGSRIKVSQEGIAGWVAANRVPLNVPDVTKDDRYVECVEGAKSEIAVPMLVGEQVVGVLDVQSTEVKAFGEDDLRTLSSVAAQAAIAIERARFFQEAHRRSQEQATLFQASAAVLSTLHIDEVLHEVAKHMTLAVDATSARVCQWNEAQRTVTIIAEYIAPHASQKEQGSDLGTVYPAEDYGTFQILRDRQPLTVSLADPEVGEKVRTHLGEFGGNTVLYLPLAVGERVIGCVEVWESRRKRHFTQEEVNLCQTIGNQAAIAIENARLFAAEESSRQKMEAVIQSMTEGLLIIDARCDIILANRRAAELLDAAAGDMAGQNLLAVCPYPSLNTLVRRALGRLPHTTRGEISIKETGSYDLGVTIALFIQDGEQVLWYVLLHDITRLKELDRMKSDFVSNVSHDLRTPLANIKLYAALAQKGRLEKRQHYLTIIESETERLEALIEDILDLSRLERGVVKLQMEPLPLAEIIQKVVGAHLATAQAKGVGLTWQVPDGLPILHADRNRLLLMLNNLLGNALQYTPRGGSVRVEARTGKWRGRPALHIAVCDTGIGIPADEQERIFERFYRGRHTPASTIGTGLGLAIVKESMALHGGEVMVESAMGQGSTFTLCFPLETEVSYA